MSICVWMCRIGDSIYIEERTNWGRRGKEESDRDYMWTRDLDSALRYTSVLSISHI